MFTYSFVKCKLFKQYCCSFYGAPLWILDSNSIRELHVAYRKALRQTWSVPYNTHTRTVLSLSEVNSLETQLYKRVCKYMRKNLNHANPLVKAVSNICLGNVWVSVLSFFSHTMLNNSVTVKARSTKFKIPRPILPGKGSVLFLALCALAPLPRHKGCNL